MAISRFRIASVVEGHGEAQAIQTLLYRVAQTYIPEIRGVDFEKPIRIPRDRLIKSIERQIEIIAFRKNPPHGIIVLIDGDDDCPADLGPKLLSRALSVGHNHNLSVVLAQREFEAWFVACAESFRGLRGLPHDLVAPVNPESIRGAKDWITRHLPRGSRYSPTLHQVEFVRRMDLPVVRERCDSFDKLCRELIRLITSLA